MQQSSGGRAGRPLKLVVFDATDTGPIALPRIERREDGTAQGTGGLTRWWRIGASLHRIAARADATRGVTSWREALAWAASESARAGRPIGEIQAWGHGGFGYMGFGGERLDAASIGPSGALAGGIDALRSSLAEGALVWLRCCSAFGTSAGQRFARALADRLEATVAGHTYIIGAWQSGTHSLRPSERPSWSEQEGNEAGRAGNGARVARVSSPFAPSTVTCLHLGLPEGL